MIFIPICARIGRHLLMPMWLLLVFIDKKAACTGLENVQAAFGYRDR